MSAMFPLSPSLWLEWARDEASLASSDNVPEIVKLYERGLSDYQERNKQIQRIRSIFHRHLSVPLKDLSSTLITYKAWELEQGTDLDIGSDDLSKVSPQVAVANKKAQQMYSERAHLEENISKKDLSDTEKFQHLMVRMAYFAVNICLYSVLKLNCNMPTICNHIA
ncbi:hypothetical protein Bca52824_088109 [Brassica carinata]|uniref:Uncharacterized protein n=1 Tax=Brassica carinata TaxID=52824 RepID=A0A8X7TQI4_BRACI|nr:hypothetical protein Bca52824_088109 [Brassica carinata]